MKLVRISIVTPFTPPQEAGAKSVKVVITPWTKEHVFGRNTVITAGQKNAYFFKGAKGVKIGGQKNRPNMCRLRGCGSS